MKRPDYTGNIVASLAGRGIAYATIGLSLIGCPKTDKTPPTIEQAPENDVAVERTVAAPILKPAKLELLLPHKRIVGTEDPCAFVICRVTPLEARIENFQFLLNGELRSTRFQQEIKRSGAKWNNYLYIENERTDGSGDVYFILNDLGPRENYNLEVIADLNGIRKSDIDHIRVVKGKAADYTNKK